jgi:hypothetical protein
VGRRPNRHQISDGIGKHFRIFKRRVIKTAELRIETSCRPDHDTSTLCRSRRFAQVANKILGFDYACFDEVLDGRNEHSCFGVAKEAFLLLLCTIVMATCYSKVVQQGGIGLNLG